MNRHALFFRRRFKTMKTKDIRLFILMKAVLLLILRARMDIRQ